MISIQEAGLEPPFESPILRTSNRGVNDKTKTTFRVKFCEAGTYETFCLINSGMKAKVTVLGELSTEEQDAIPDSQTTLLNAAIKSEKFDEIKRPSAVVDFKEVFDKMRPEDLLVDPERQLLVEDFQKADVVD